MAQLAQLVRDLLETQARLGQTLRERALLGSELHNGAIQAIYAAGAGIVAGAKGYLMKEIDGEALTAAIIDVAEGRVVLSPDATARRLRIVRAGPAVEVPQPGLSRLSHQEKRGFTMLDSARNITTAGDSTNGSETYQNFYRMPGTPSTYPAPTRTTLIRDVSSLIYYRYDRLNAAATTDAGTKRIRLNLTISKTSRTVVSATDTTVSASFIMRNKTST